jgi:conjugal transfer pilin signal peptidase TrbI
MMLCTKMAAAPWWQKTIAVIGITIATSWVLTRSLGIKIGYDGQRETCLDFRLSLVKYDPQYRFSTGEIVSFDPSSVVPGFFPKGRHLGKQVAGVPGDRIDVSPEGVMVNDILLSRDFSVKYPPKYQSIIIPPNHYFVMGTALGSFDSRYYGLVPQSAVYGVVTPII